MLQQYFNIKNLSKDIKYFIGKKSSFWCGDIEAKLNENNEWEFVLGTMTNGEEFRTYDNIEYWFEDLEYEKITIYFHNLDFDILFFLKNKNIRTKIENSSIINSGNMMLSVNIAGVEFRNSLSLFPMSLKNIVQKFLHEDNQEWENDKANVLDLDLNILSKYCMRDSYYLWVAIMKYSKFFKDKYGLKKLKLTAPSIALKVWEKNYLKDQTFISYNRLNNFFNNNYYFGGHTEKFIQGRYIWRNVNYYDVNSLYPSVMKELRFINSKYKRIKPTIKGLKKLVLEEKLFYCEVTINIDSEYLRFFPVFDAKEQVNKYPMGNIRVKLSEEGIDFILRWGSWDNIVEVHQILIGQEDKIIKPFEEYVNEIYSMRKSDKGNDMIFKLLLNSLYGKFGQKNQRDVKYINMTNKPKGKIKSMVTTEDMHITTVQENINSYSKKYLRKDIAGKITEVARLKMGNYINTIRKEFGENSVIYTDTDSIITTACFENSDLSNLIDNNQLGKLSNEIGCKDNVIILGQKMYHFYKSGKKATKGVKDMNIKDFREIIKGSKGANHFINKKFTKFHTLINKGFFGLQIAPYEIKMIRERLD